MANPTVSQARSFQENPRHYPRKLQVGVYNFFSKRIPYKPLPANPKKILVQAQEKIGDAVLLFPTISGLRNLFPESVIHLLCSRINEPLFQSIKEIEKTMVYRSGRQFWNALKETKYPPFGLLQLPIFLPPKSCSRRHCTASNLGRKISA